MAVSLQPESLRAMGEIMNSEDPANWLNNGKIESANATNT